MDNANKLCFCFSDACKTCNSSEFQAQQKATRKRRLTVPDYRKDAGPAWVASPCDCMDCAIAGEPTH